MDVRKGYLLINAEFKLIRGRDEPKLIKKEIFKEKLAQNFHPELFSPFLLITAKVFRFSFPFTLAILKILINNFPFLQREFQLQSKRKTYKLCLDCRHLASQQISSHVFMS